MDADEEQITKLSEGLRAEGRAGEHVGRVLNRAIENEDSRKTILFGLQQQPAFREMLKKLQDEEDSGDGQN